MEICALSAGVPRGDTPGEGEGDEVPDRDRSGPGGVAGGPTSTGRDGEVSGGVTGVGRGDSAATGTGVRPAGAAGAVGGTPKPPKGDIFMFF